MSEQHHFQAEVGRLLDIVAHALYSEREIFLRELISNSADACDKLRYLSISSPDLSAGDGHYAIDVSFDPQARTLTVSDNGIGMDREELIKNLGTIAHSGTREMVKSISGTDKSNVANLIGQFGVGFYSSFMVANRVDVLSRKAGSAEAFIWSSDGRGGYSLDQALKDARGTEITLHIKDESSEFLLEERLKNVIKKYSDHISFPIRLNGVVVNTASALWMRPKAEVTETQYREFYRAVSGAMHIDEPWMTLHWRAEGAFEYTNLLFVPSMKPFDLYDPKRHHGTKLYVKRVFIAEGVESLLPPFLRFIKGVVDSEDLPLNISREMLQANPMMAKMNTAITRKILTELEQKAKDDIKAYENFWALFGPVVKEGLYDAHAHRDQLCRVARFYSSTRDGLVSLDEYVEAMQAGQEEIYYLAAPSVEAGRNSPQLESFRARGVEVLFMTDTIDEFWIPIQDTYKNKKFRSITRGAVNASKDGPKEAGVETQNLIDRLKNILKDEVKDVTLSERLVDSPVCLVAPEGGVDMQMERILKRTQSYDSSQRHVLEINADHPVIRRMQELAANAESGDMLAETAFLLLDQARIIEGEPLKNPAAFARRMSRAIEKGLLAG